MTPRTHDLWPRLACVAVLCCVFTGGLTPVYGAGVLSSQYFGESMLSVDQRAFAMGGAGLGATGAYVDAVNPASLARVSTASFNLTYRPFVNWGSDGSSSQRLTSGRLSSGVFSLPLQWGVALGLGIEQLHSAQYSFAEACTTEAGLAYTRKLNRSGGVYAGGLSIAYSPGSGIGIGAGWRWLFGSVRTISNLDFENSSYVDTKDELLQKHSGGYPALGFFWDGGTVGLGAYWRGSSTGNGLLTIHTTHYVDRSTEFDYSLPSRFGAGIGVGPLRGLSLAADVWKERWSEATFEGQSDEFRDVTVVSIGLEFVPTNGERTYPPIRIGYRSRPGYYLVPLPDGGMSSTPPSDEAFTAGTMLGAGQGQGVVQVAIAVGRRGGLLRYGVKETYLEASLGFTGFEPWTRRRLPGP
ncbi:hypothetical protein JXA88_02475 [Candidatus Fermentibacteria bacterium]|nr:hypothetical protein [Candidatus Fermentibacteria bacterium]